MHESNAFGRIHVESDRTSGNLQFRNRDQYRPVRFSNEEYSLSSLQFHEREKTPSLVPAILTGDTKELWSGVIFTREQVRELFQLYFASGRAEGTRILKVLRLETDNGRNFDLAMCNAGEEQERVICTIPRHEVVELALEVSGSVWRCILLDEDRDHKKLQKIHSRSRA